MNTTDREIEVRFLNINPRTIIQKLKKLKAKDKGEYLVKEIIFYDKDKKWLKTGKFVRIRQNNNKILVAYKHHQQNTASGTYEIEFEVSDLGKAKVFIENLGLVAFREQEKRRHTFKLGDTIVDIDFWPKLPPYLEIEGLTEKDLKDMAQKLDLNWKDAIFENARIVIEKYYKIPVSTYKYFTFDKIG